MIVASYISLSLLLKCAVPLAPLIIPQQDLHLFVFNYRPFIPAVSTFSFTTDTLVGVQFSTLDQLGISTVAQFEEYMVGRGSDGSKTDTYLHFNSMPLLKAKTRDIEYPVPDPEPASHWCVEPHLVCYNKSVTYRFLAIASCVAFLLILLPLVID